MRELIGFCANYGFATEGDDDTQKGFGRRKIPKFKSRMSRGACQKLSTMRDKEREYNIMCAQFKTINIHGCS